MKNFKFYMTKNKLKLYALITASIISIGAMSCIINANNTNQTTISDTVKGNVR